MPILGAKTEAKDDGVFESECREEARAGKQRTEQE